LRYVIPTAQRGIIEVITLKNDAMVSEKTEAAPEALPGFLVKLPARNEGWEIPN